MMVPLLYTVTIMPYRLAFVDFRIPLTGHGRAAFSFMCLRNQGSSNNHLFDCG